MNKKKGYLIGLIALGVVMFGLIFLTVALTGDREIGDFTAQDRTVFTIFLIAEVLVVAILFFFAAKLGKLNRNAQPVQPRTVTKQEKVLRRRGVILLVISLLAALLLNIAGILLGKHWEEQDRTVVYALLAVGCALPPILLGISILLGKRYARSLENKRVEEIQQILRSQRELAAQTSRETLVFLKKWRVLTGLFAVLLTILGAAVALFGGWGTRSSNATPIVFYAAALIMSGLSRLRFRLPTAFMEEDKTYVSKEDYPHLYAMAEKAARESGCTTPVRISFTTDGNIGILDLGSAVSLEIGTLLLSILSEQELASILNHEFAHVIASKGNKEDTYANWLRMGKPLHVLSLLTELLYGYLDGVYGFRYFLYEYATSVTREAEADRAMVRGCDEAVAGSALLKTYYHDRYEYESGTYDVPSIYAEEEPARDVLRQRIEEFRRRVAARSEVWNSMIPREIMSRSASHPTMKMRLDALGVTDYRTLPGTGSPEFDRERDSAVSYLDQLIYDNRRKDYEKLHKAYYIEPLQCVDDWKAAGEPLVAEEYRDVVQALHALGRYTEEEQLCDRAIRELPDAATPYAYFIRGRLRLRRYDPAGLDDLYHAMASNNNFVQDSLQEIGAFCCITGNQEELGHYRERAVELMQKDKDEHSQVGVLKRGDRLSAEQLPEGVLEETLAYIRSIENGEIQQIYLVRKTITEDFFTSAFVVKFTEDSDPDAQDEIMHKIFLYLDTVSDWQYSLFDYREVAKVKVETIPGSLVYEKQGSEG